jgi:hypothetical protein
MTTFRSNLGEKPKKGKNVLSSGRIDADAFFVPFFFLFLPFGVVFLARVMMSVDVDLQ